MPKGHETGKLVYGDAGAVNKAASTKAYFFARAQVR